MSSIQQSHEFVLEQAKLNIEFARANPANVEQAKQVNAALASIVASERNMVMHRALERAIKNDRHEILPKLPEC